MDTEKDKDLEINLPRLVRKKRTTNSTTVIILLVVFFALCAFVGYCAARAVSDPLIPVEEPKEGEEQPQYASEDILNLLLLGVDQRENEPSRADTIILASVDLKEKQVHLLSIPRDTRTDIAGKGIKRKINYAHAVGGPQLTVDTVELFLDLPVHYYIETNFDGFSGIIDVLGGININVEQRMYFPEEGIDLHAGLQKLGGHDALSYVRWRGDGTGDIGRIQRQQKFFRALADQALTFSTIWKIPDLLGEINKCVKTDMSLQKMIILANKLKDIDNIELATATVPGVPDDVNYGASYWIHDQAGLTAILEGIYGEDKHDTDITNPDDAQKS
ncbi:MAG: LCP family protein [Clostridia bacterium]|jgi:LCP family protein required for cell wall assembly|nr:LCP family protein [Clostridia bacterium]